MGEDDSRGTTKWLGVAGLVVAVAGGIVIPILLQDDQPAADECLEGTWVEDVTGRSIGLEADTSVKADAAGTVEVTFAKAKAIWTLDLRLYSRPEDGAYSVRLSGTLNVDYETSEQADDRHVLTVTSEPNGKATRELFKGTVKQPDDPRHDPRRMIPQGAREYYCDDETLTIVDGGFYTKK
ncbi:hypothetical protein BLA60_06000 [Actinophytocola xinjiangensis]|uniref:Uncharacterized protein n=1 Tax=Actinophytocola xinjiangensis TaxID=485602 RepID=A0A7Z0WQW2_9PSEU|nr:hypothetical protein [Actinophytocola xinjiangensis]OLF12820.1 hypothetical protein BLA60_06000 [Actinophytocola xinjiangensis]